MSRRAAAVLLATVTAAAVLLVCFSPNPHWLAAALWTARETLYLWAPALALTGAAALVGKRWREPKATWLAIGAFIVLFIAWGWWALSWHDYQQARDYYTSSVRVDDASLPELDDRVPYQVAAAQARSNLGDISGGIVHDGTTYLPRRGEYTTLVQRKGWLTGYEAMLTQALDERGEATSYVCHFDRDKAGLRDGGWFAHSLTRALASHTLAARYDPDDLWAYCGDNYEPLLVIPLKRQVGLLYVTERPAGYALYNGRTGALTIHKDAGSMLPGPVYPLSLAERQREALSAPGGYLDWRAGRGGWEADSEDVNSDNSTEFTLADGDSHGARYVTPLTGRGSATAISAVALVDAGDATPGRLATLHVHRNKPAWKSTTAIASRIKSDYSDIPNWQNVRIFEVAPTGPNSWVATVGIRDGNTISYRVRGVGNLAGSTATCLHHPEHDTRLRCGRVYAAGDPGPGEQPPGGPPPTEMGSYTDQQLLDEIGRRLAGNR